MRALSLNGAMRILHRGDLNLAVKIPYKKWMEPAIGLGIFALIVGVPTIRGNGWRMAESVDCDGRTVLPD